MNKVLVTGGAGFIGSNFILYMLKNNNSISIVNLDKLTYAGNLANLKEIKNNTRYKFIKGDICDKELVKRIIENEKIDTLINFAAESHVDRSISDASEFINTNIKGTQVLLDCVKEAWVLPNGDYKDGVKYLQVSTDEVYGSLGEDGYFTEKTPIDAHSPYSASKASADLLVKSYYDTHKLPVLITRCSNNYGPHQFPEKLIPLIINNCLNMNKIPIYGDGLNVRDWLYVEDHCKAIELVAKNGKIGDVYNIGGHNERTNIRIVKTIINYLHNNVDEKINESLIIYVSDRRGHDRRYGIDPTKITKELGWVPETAFEVGIESTIKWYLSNVKWLNDITSGKYLENQDQIV